MVSIWISGLDDAINGLDSQVTQSVTKGRSVEIGEWRQHKNLGQIQGHLIFKGITKIIMVHFNETSQFRKQGADFEMFVFWNATTL